MVTLTARKRTVRSSRVEDVRLLEKVRVDIYIF